MDNVLELNTLIPPDDEEECFPYFDDDLCFLKHDDADFLIDTKGTGLSCKYLLASLVDIKGPEFIADPTILNLLRFEAKKGSKWASDEWIGLEQLYNSLERALNDLKSYDQLKAFHHRVHSRDAPDYYEIIKKPMDFSTMRKKLNQFTYKSKQEFIDDLELIYTNCMSYNVHPESIFRTYAAVLKEKTAALSSTIPDIAIRHYSEAPPPSLKNTGKVSTNLILNTNTIPFGTQPVLKWSPSSTPLPHIPLPCISFEPSSFYLPVSSPTSPSSPNLIHTSHRALDAAKSSVLHWRRIRSVAQSIQTIKEEQLYKPPPDIQFSLDHLDLIHSHVLTEDQAYLHLQQYLVLVLAHIGFESCLDSTLRIITDLFLHCLFNIATTLHILGDHNLDGEKGLLKALELNGINLVQLQDHAILGVCRTSRRLGELHKRLRHKLKDLTLGGFSSLGLDDLPMDAPDDAFASGSFLTRLLDEDFFGLGALGLDAMSIPTHLWYTDKSNPGYYRLPRISPEASSEPRLPLLEEPTGFQPVTRETQTIGLMKRFLESKWNKYGDRFTVLPEDEAQLSYKAKRARQQEREVLAGLATKKIKKAKASAI